MAKVKQVIRVKDIVLEIGGKEIHLSPDEARQLAAELNNTLGLNRIQYFYPQYPSVTDTIQVPYWSVSAGSSTLADVACNSATITASGSYAGLDTGNITYTSTKTCQ